MAEKQNRPFQPGFPIAAVDDEVDAPHTSWEPYGTNSIWPPEYRYLCTREALREPCSSSLAYGAILGRLPSLRKGRKPVISGNGPSHIRGTERLSESASERVIAAAERAERALRRRSPEPPCLARALSGCPRCQGSSRSWLRKQATRASRVHWGSRSSRN